jgi:hypothetical protein
MTIPTLAPEIQQIDGNMEDLLSNIRWERRWCGNPNPRKGEGTYYRYLEHQQSRERCLQVVIFYRIQRFPYHPHDFAPIYFYFDDRNQLKRILFDHYHHNVASFPITARSKTRVVVYAPWHAFRVGEIHWAQRPFRSTCWHLTDELLRQWWSFDDMRQFKLRSKFVNPWHPHLFQESAPDQATFRDEAPCPRCGSIYHLDYMHYKDGIYQLDILCPNQHKYSAMYNTYSQAMEVREI